MVSQRKLRSREGVFVGITNSPFITTKENLTTPIFGGELEILDFNQVSGHAIFVQVKHVLEQKNLQYSTTELALGYRFRVVNKTAYSLYANVKLATLNFTNATVITDNNDNVSIEAFNQSAF